MMQLKRELVKNMNKTIEKIVKSIESLSSAEKSLLIGELMHKKILTDEQIESLTMAESDFNDYLTNLEDYENKLAKGEIQW